MAFTPVNLPYEKTNATHKGDGFIFSRIGVTGMVIHRGNGRAGLSIVLVVPWERPPRRQGPPDRLPIFYHAVLSFTEVLRYTVLS